MPKNRLEAFSDGVIAIVITMLVLEIRVPQLGRDVGTREILRAIAGLLPNLAAYVISFLVCAVWWTSHHQFIQDLHHVDRPLLWANHLFLLWLAFLPFPTALLGQYPAQPVAAALYGVVGAGTGCSFWLMRWYATLRGQLMRSEIPIPERRRRVRISVFGPMLYLAGALCSLVLPGLAICIYAAIPAYFAFATLRSPASHG